MTARRVVSRQPLRPRVRHHQSVAGVRKRVVLMSDGPPSVELAQAYGEPKPLLRFAPQLLGRAASQQGERERDICAGCDVERFDVEPGTGRLPVKESRPGLAVRIDAADAWSGGWTSNMTRSGRDRPVRHASHRGGRQRPSAQSARRSAVHRSFKSSSRTILLSTVVPVGVMALAALRRLGNHVLRRTPGLTNGVAAPCAVDVRRDILRTGAGLARTETGFVPTEEMS